VLRQAIYAVALIQAMVGAGAELPARVYTTQDGLVHDEVLRIRRDSRGYLWLGTADGLSIFDGYGFSNYTTADGLPNNAVTDILETRSGEYWIATRGGLCRFEPNASPGHRFVTVRAAQNALAVIVNVLAERRDGSIWFGTEGGLWRLHLTGKTYSAVRVPLPSPAPDSQRVFAITEDHDGALWIAASDGIYVLRGDAASRFGKHDGLPDDYTHDLLADNRGRLWAATADGVYQITFPCPGHSFVERAYTNRGLPRETAISLLQSADGKLWVAGRGLFEFDPDARAEQPAFRRVLAPFGGNLLAKALAEDADHNLWVGGAGAVKVTRHGFTTFSFADGLRALRMHALLEDRDGRVCAITSWNGLTIHRFDGSRFTAVSSYLPPGFHYSWGESQISFQDHAGEWWVPTENGLLRFARPKRIEDLASATPAVYSTALGLPSDVVLRLFEDSRGDVWIGVYKGLARWIRRSGKIQAYSGVDGIPFVTAHPPELPTPNAIAEDRSGQIWIGFHPSGLARVRGGRFEFFTSVNGLPNGQINGVYCDSRGHVWVASSQGGLARIDNPGAAKPVFRVYTTAQGLSSNQVYHTVDDAQHRIYATVGSGVDRLDPETGSVRHFTTADGVPALPKYALRDRTGALWFASA
jgi:ligand-binding sensor domain-containing protein